MRKKKDFLGLIIFAITMRLMNYAAENIRGSRVAFDPILALWEASQPDKTMAQRVGRILGEFLGNIPVGSNMMSMYPEYGMTLDSGLGLKMKLPTRKQFFGSDATRFGNLPLFLSAIKDPLYNIVTPYAGKQIQKTIRGLRAWNYGSFDFGKKTVYLDQNTKNLIQGALFGPYAIDEVKSFAETLSARLEKIKDTDED